MVDLNTANYTEIPPCYEFALKPEETALLIVDVQYANCSRNHGLGARLQEEGQGARSTSATASGLRYRYDRIEKVVLPNLQKLLAFFREHKLRVIYVTLGSETDDFSDIPPSLRGWMKWGHYRIGTREGEILDEVKPIAGEYVINKTTKGAFLSTGLNQILRHMGINYLVVCGVDTVACPGNTAREAADLGYHSIMVDDCCATQAESWQRLWMLMFQKSFGRVATSDQVIEELQRALGSQ